MKNECGNCKHWDKAVTTKKDKWTNCSTFRRMRHKTMTCGVFKPKLPLNKAPDMIFHVRESDRREKRMATLKNLAAFFFVLAVLILAYAALVASFAQAIWRN